MYEKWCVFQKAHILFFGEMFVHVMSILLFDIIVEGISHIWKYPLMFVLFRYHQSKYWIRDRFTFEVQNGGIRNGCCLVVFLCLLIFPGHFWMKTYSRC